MAALQELRINLKWVGGIIVCYGLWCLVSTSVYVWGRTQVDSKTVFIEALKTRQVSEAYAVSSESYKLVHELTTTYRTEELKQILLHKVSEHRLRLISLEEVGSSISDGVGKTKTKTNELSKDKTGEPGTVKSGEIEVLRLEVSGDLREFLLLLNEVSEAYPTVQYRPESMTLKNGELHIIYLVQNL